MDLFKVQIADCTITKTDYHLGIDEDLDLSIWTITKKDSDQHIKMSQASMHGIKRYKIPKFEFRVNLDQRSIIGSFEESKNSEIQ